MTENNKFSCPVSMKVTQEQYERDLKGYLLDLGYETQHLNLIEEGCEFLVTNYSGDSHVITNTGDWGIRSNKRYFIKGYNPELFLALAGMREGDKIHVGEYMINLDDGELCKITSVDVDDDDSVGAFSSNYVQECWRKATKEEIIDLFTEGQEADDSKNPPKHIDSSENCTSPWLLRGLLGKIDTLQKENDELKGVTRLREGYIDGRDSKNWVEFADRLHKTPITLYNDNGEILNKPLTPHECYKNEKHYDSLTFPSEEVMESEGYKESENKLSYELDWNFIEAMAKRMSSNKSKYQPYNWTKPLDPEQLKQSLFRHVMEVMKGNYDEDGMENAHLFSIALNCMMINYQLKHNKTNE